MIVSDFPKRIEIEFTNCCNSKCSYCPRRFGVGNEGFMDLELFKKIIKESEDYPETTLQLHRRGESLLHPIFIEMLEYIKGRFKSIQLATNAIFLSEEIAKCIAQTVSFVSFSIDLAESYPQKRGVDLYNIVESNILNFLRINRDAETQISMVKDESVSDADVLNFKSIWLDRVCRVRVYQEHSIDGVYGSTQVKRKKRSPCVKPFTDMVTYWDGRVVRCNHDWSNVALGDLNESTINEIWKNAQFEEIRKEQLSLQFTDDICRECDSWYAEEGCQETGYVFRSR